MLTEAERNILLDPRRPAARREQALAARSLVGTKRDVRGSATFNRKSSATCRRRSTPSSSITKAAR